MAVFTCFNVEKFTIICYNHLRKPDFAEVIKLKFHIRKMVAPIVISVIVILYCVAYFGFIITLVDGIGKYVLGIIPLVLSAVMIKVCIERVREIKKGEEDDIGKY